MKKLICLIISVLMLTSCELELLDNRKLDGNWQLRQMDDLSAGSTHDMSHSYIYWGVQGDLLQVRDIDNNLRILFRYEKNGDELKIYSPYLFITKDELTELDDVEQLQPLGITEIENHYKIEHLSNDHLTLRDKTYRLYFKKY